MVDPLCLIVQPRVISNFREKWKKKYLVRLNQFHARGIHFTHPPNGYASSEKAQCEKNDFPPSTPSAIEKLCKTASINYEIIGSRRACRGQKWEGDTLTTCTITTTTTVAVAISFLLFLLPGQWGATCQPHLPTGSFYSSTFLPLCSPVLMNLHSLRSSLATKFVTTSVSTFCFEMALYYSNVKNNAWIFLPRTELFRLLNKIGYFIFNSALRALLKCINLSTEVFCNVAFILK